MAFSGNNALDQPYVSGLAKVLWATEEAKMNGANSKVWIER